VPKVSQEHLDGRRAQILAGARQAFARFGYEGTTVQRLEEEIGLSRGAIFHYFGGKAELFAELAREVNRQYTTLLVDKGLDAALREMAQESSEWLGVVFEAHARLRHDPDFERRMTPSPDELSRLRDWFERQQAEGVFRDDVDFIELGRFATMVVNGLALRVVGGDATDVEATIRLLHDALGPRQ
jgi:AcrR family transcriptional regulator